jgi:hypothetical protein
MPRRLILHNLTREVLHIHLQHTHPTVPQLELTRRLHMDMQLIHLTGQVPMATPLHLQVTEPTQRQERMHKQQNPVCPVVLQVSQQVALAVC